MAAGETDQFRRFSESPEDPDNANFMRMIGISLEAGPSSLASYRNLVVADGTRTVRMWD